MDRPGEFLSDMFDFRRGGLLSVEAIVSSFADRGPVAYSVEESEDRSCWVPWTEGTVSAGERVDIPCTMREAPWGRIRLRLPGGGPRVIVRWFGEGMQ